MSTRFFFLVVSPVLLALGVFGVMNAASGVRQSQLRWDSDVREEVQAIVGDRFLEPIDEAREQQLFDAAMKGYVRELDAFSRYFNADEKRELDEETSGSFAGVGLRISAGEGGVQVVAVYRDGPADRAGVRPGDVIVRVGDEDVRGRTTTEVVARVKGEAGTNVEVWVERGEEPARAIVVARGQVDIDSVPAVRMLDDEAFGYVRLSQFSESSPAELREHVHALVRERGARGVVLDLRGNLGGVVRAAVQVAGLFLPPGSLVCSTRSRDGIAEYRIQDEPGAGAFRDVPLILLVDGATASASEILAGALQDHGRAVLVGERTYGKFLVQKLVPLVSTEGLVRLTTAQYETPKGRSGHRDRDNGERGGLLPDVVVRLQGAARDDLGREFELQIGPRWDVLDGRRGDVTIDGQIAAALALLRGDAPPPEVVSPVVTERG